jgi:hypothetical protein
VSYSPYSPYSRLASRRDTTDDESMDTLAYIASCDGDVRAFSEVGRKVIAVFTIDSIEQREHELLAFARARILRDQLDREVGQAGMRKGGRL